GGPGRLGRRSLDLGLEVEKRSLCLELNLLESLHKILNRSTITAADDSWLWKHDPSGVYSVKSDILALSRSIADEVIFSVEEEMFLLKSVENLGPFKSWNLFLATSTREVVDSSKSSAAGRH
ncbi:hypothetical protein A2U01_0012426, partial [Trifolium medium]|nr:hypothetical protein [Trifolium medium]